MLKEASEYYRKILYAQVTPWEKVNRVCSHLLWRYVFNAAGTLTYLMDQSARARRETPLARSLVAQLNSHGFARTTLAELGQAPLLADLQVGAGQLEQLAQQAKNAHQYPYRHLEARLSPLADGPLRDVLDRYAGTHLVQRNAIGMVNVPVDFPTRAQRLWHIDVEDYFVLKVYVFLTAADAFSGPLDYVDSTHPKGRFSSEAARLMKHTFLKSKTDRYDFQVPDELLFRAIRPDAVTRIEASSGDVLIFDARGLHRGGHVLSQTRRVGILTFTGANTIHGTYPPASRWGRICHHLTWKTNVTETRPLRLARI